MNYDVAIIGTGPAGGSAANVLAQTGLSVIILEREQLGRLKPCGGLMPSSATKFFDWDISGLIERRIGTVRNLYNFSDPHIEERNKDSLLLVNRAKFDAGLIRFALEKANGNLVLKEDFNVTSVKETQDGIEIANQKGKVYKARYLIAADGVSSRTARCLNLNQGREQATAIDAEIWVSPHRFNRESCRATFNFFCLPGGYGWIFPKEEGVLSCGVGSWIPTTGIKTHLLSFLDQSFPGGQIKRKIQYGFPIPVFTGKTHIATNRACLVGDAASLVDPTIGEGISYALISGQIAAKTVLGIVSNQYANGLGLLNYQKKVYDAIAPQLELKSKFLSLTYKQAPEYYYQKVVKGLGAYKC